MGEESNSRVSVSEDKLYRALAEQELRLLQGFSERLDEKLAPIQSRVTVLELANAGRTAVAERQDKSHEIRTLTKPTLIATAVSAIGVLLGHVWH